MGSADSAGKKRQRRIRGAQRREGYRWKLRRKGEIGKPTMMKRKEGLEESEVNKNVFKMRRNKS